MKKALFFSLLFVCIGLQAKTIRVGVVDTGFGPYSVHVLPLCPDVKFADTSAVNGVYNLSEPAPDKSGHGTHTSYLIHQAVHGKVIGNEMWGAREKVVEIAQLEADYCQIPVKFWESSKQDAANSKNNWDGLAEAVKYLIDQKVDVINISAGGTEETERESCLIKQALDAGITVVAAAGNESADLNKEKYFPAMSDPRVVVVGALQQNEIKEKDRTVTKVLERTKSSNYGLKSMVWEMGFEIVSLCPKGNGGVGLCVMTGTSQAAAIRTGKIIKELIEKRRNNEPSNSNVRPSGKEKNCRYTSGAGPYSWVSTR